MSVDSSSEDMTVSLFRQLGLNLQRVVFFGEHGVVYFKLHMERQRDHITIEYVGISLPIRHAVSAWSQWRAQWGCGIPPSGPPQFI